MPGNLGQTTQRLRRRSADPMAAYDALPPPLRAWLSMAALPWSPASCLRIWRRWRAAGASVPEALAALDRAERRALANGERAVGTDRLGQASESATDKPRTDQGKAARSR
ncbi:MAG: DUF6525 family protein [Paracoccus sp. (in: a-proteobacteria)]|nr:DUF6525 family protein [Paracoccus sp. (in: a-proteobacteria)]